MKIRAVEAIPLDARLAAPFKFGHVVRTTSANVLVRVATDDGVTDRVEPVLTGADPFQWRRLLHDLEPRLFAHPFTTAAVSTALLDVVGRALDVPVSTLLGGRFRDIVEIHGSVGWDEKPGVVAATALAQAENARTLKLHAGRGTLEGNLARIAAARNAAHPFILDVNGLWSPFDAVLAAARLRDAGVVLGRATRAARGSPGHGRRHQTPGRVVWHRRRRGRERAAAVLSRDGGEPQNRRRRQRRSLQARWAPCRDGDDGVPELPARAAQVRAPDHRTRDTRPAQGLNTRGQQ